METSSETPLAILQRLNQLAQQHPMTPEGALEALPEQWLGVAFRLAGRYCVCRTGEVEEVVPYPVVAPVPRARHWLRGVANVHGNLLPIMDLAGFLGDGMSTITRSSRVLVARADQLTTGLLVDEVLGMRQFPLDSLSAAAGDVPAGLAAVLSGEFDDQGQSWQVLSVAGLASHPEFSGAAN
ncbi:chemotaxis protein CheW [Methylonatrum kenyense]|uniref:chemotaxis protein CheW n=1 Tax=Methylonatrum kenyense TaxID=455253 RepID=UPI0020C049A3|nr:chemotaxis protein CheW [Methylonatrum kenyense]MCK8516632.1 chemotaxis protein CheW [Methylonatrum kenyense]